MTSMLMKKAMMKQTLAKGFVQRTGLAEVRELVFRQPGTDDD